MPAFPLSLTDVLRDEFLYFFSEAPEKAIHIDRAHVRELSDLARRLKIILSQPDIAGDNSRLSLLARQAGKQDCWQPDAPHEDGKPDSEKHQNREKAIVDAFDQMLAASPDNWLLQELLKDPDSAMRERLTSSELLRDLLRVPKARRLLLEEPSLAGKVLSDPELLEQFNSDSAVVRLLRKEEFTPAFELYPALLSTIADDKELADSLFPGDGEAGEGHLRKVFEAKRRRRLLFKLFAVGRPARGFYARASRRISRILSYFQKTEVPNPAADLQEISRSATAIKQMLDVRCEKPEQVVPDPIGPVPLSHFNALLLEAAYGDYLADGHSVRAMHEALRGRNMGALCLSGGGIRSATFNLGILQGLADHRLLGRFHYLSTVSGGGYIGSWLSSWMRRHHEGTTGVAKDLSRQAVDPTEPEVKPLQHLREYSSYLAPKATIFSVDMWTIFATYLRNLLLNWTILLPTLAVVIAAPRLMEALILAGKESNPKWWGYLAIVAALAAVLGVALVRPKSDLTASKRHRDEKSIRKQGKKYRWWLGFLLVGGLSFATFWPDGGPMLTMGRMTTILASLSAFGAFIYALRRSIASVALDSSMAGASRWRRLLRGLRCLFLWRSFGRNAASEVTFAAIAGAAAGALMYSIFGAIPLDDPGSIRFEVYVCIALPLYLLVFFVESTLMVGLTTKSSSDHDRDWWGRSAAVMLICGVEAALLSFTVIFGPLLLLAAKSIAASLGGVSSAVTWLLGKRPQKAKGAEEQKSSKAASMILNIAASITVVFFVALLSLGTTYALHALTGSDYNGAHEWTVSTGTPDGLAKLVGAPFKGPAAEHLTSLRTTNWLLLVWLMATLYLFALGMSWLLNINIYSMHGMYRNRLMRAYLGASRWDRHPDGFTGFDPQDDIPMWALRPEALWSSSFLDFDGFVKKLFDKTKTLSNEPWTARLNDVEVRLRAYAGNPASVDREELMAATIDGINDLMRTHDLMCDIPAPPSLQLFRANRRYLESRFPSEIKKAGEIVRPTGSSDGLIDEADLLNLAKLHIDDAGDLDPVGPPPLHILNTSMNLVGGGNLAWQERKADSFTISPLHAGNHRLGYRDTSEYGERIPLGTAMAISGAAVSPNRGAKSSPAVTFLMTLFNARLGWWLGNPGVAGAKTYTESSPSSALEFIIDEAIGATDDCHPWVFLSDGGHFDNLGLYEMVLRRCKYIVVCDASADGNYGFGDLGNAVRKIRIDLGVPIELATKYVGPQENERFGRYCAIGKILYPDVDGYDGTPADYHKQCGHLLYIKPAVYSDCPPDVRTYRKENTSFPHETTADQFFSESQFESYRALGRHTIGRICESKIGEPAWRAPNLATFFARAHTYVQGDSEPTRNRPVKDVQSVVDWMQESLG
jgi:hypothetical protein